MRPPRTPHFREVLLEHVRVTGLALRGPLLIGLALLAIATIVALPTMMAGRPLSINGWPTWLPGIMGALLPIAVWGRDEPFGPGFLWALPVDRRRHAFTKLAAGWMWLTSGVILFLLWLLCCVTVTGERVLPDTLHLLASTAAGIQAVDPATLRTIKWDPGPLMWLVPFAGATATYFFGTALMLGTRHPLRWVIGIALLFFVTSVIGQPVSAQLGMGWLDDAPNRLLQWIVGARYGLDAVLTARSETLSATAVLTTGKSLRVWWEAPDLADWGIATLLWMSIGALALWGAVSRHAELRRG